jgi:hypothetical protein
MSRRRLALEILEDRLVPSSVPLHVVGNELQDPAGNAVVLRGVNLTGLEFRPDGDNTLLAADTAINTWHANLLRLPVNEDFWFGHDEFWTGGEADDGGAAYRSLVDQVINIAQQDNVYVVLDLHWSDMGVWGANNGQHFMPDDHSTLFWQDAAARYANNTAVLYDPYNEPTVGISNPSDADFATWHDGGMITETDLNTGAVIGTYHSPGMQGLIDTIRGTGANNIVVPEGLDFGSDLTGVLTGHALSDPAGKLMYQSHLYYDKLANPAILNSVLTVGQQYPIYIGEWGDGGVIGQPSADAMATNQNMITFLEAHPYSWTAWAFTPDLDQSGFNLITDWNTAAPTSDYGVYVQADLAAHANEQPSAALPDLTGVHFSLTAAEDGSTHDLVIQNQNPQPDGTAQITGLYDGQAASGALAANGDGTLAIGFGPSDSVGIDGTISGNAGQYIIFGLDRANQGGIAPELNGNQVATLTAQVITFGALPDATYGGAPITLGATADSGLPVSYQVLSGPATVQGSILTITGVGVVTVEASQPGDGVNFDAATPVEQSFMVNQAATLVALHASARSAAAGQMIAFTATVAAQNPAAGAPDGMVTFMDGGNVLGTATLTNGVAMLRSAKLGAGTHHVTAVYDGSDIFMGSTSTAVTETIHRAATKTVLTSSARTALHGQTIELTARITAVGAAVSPSGTVTIKDGATVLGKVVVVNGVAVLDIATLKRGKHSITAIYSGDPDFLASNSTSSSVTIK